MVASGEAIYRDKMTFADAEHRIETYWKPFHDMLAALANGTRATFGRCVLVDCLTLWLNNLLFSEHHAYPDTGLITPPEAWTTEIDALLTALPLLPGEVILVSNEIGLGVVPMGAVTRFYVDELGRLNQRLAALADNVHLLVAGIPMVVKGPALGTNS
mgnify:CR=1 FL=1